MTVIQDDKAEDTKTAESSLAKTLAGPLSAGFYIFTSLAMTSLTKYAASKWLFPGSSFLLLIECIATVIALLWQAPHGKKYTPFGPNIRRHLPLVTLTKALNMYLSFLAMKRTSLPVYNVLKRLQPVYALVQDWAIRGAIPTGGELFGILAMCLGTLVTGLGDLDFDVAGYAIALVAAGCQSLYLVLARRAQDEVKDLSHVDLLYYTAFYNCLIFFPLSVVEYPEIQKFLANDGEILRLLIFMVPYVLLGTLLNYATFWCTAANSPLATAVAGSAKGILSTIVGMVQFGAHLTMVGWLGLLGNTGGGLLYSLAHTRQRLRKSKEKNA